MSGGSPRSHGGCAKPAAGQAEGECGEGLIPGWVCWAACVRFYCVWSTTVSAYRRTQYGSFEVGRVAAAAAAAVRPPFVSSSLGSIRRHRTPAFVRAAFTSIRTVPTTPVNDVNSPPSPSATPSWDKMAVTYLFTAGRRPNLNFLRRCSAGRHTFNVRYHCGLRIVYVAFRCHGDLFCSRRVSWASN